MKGAEGLRTKIWGNHPCKVTLGFSCYPYLLRSLLAEFQDRVRTVGQAVTLDIKGLGGINERGDGW
jgi:hypothetical protein